MSLTQDDKCTGIIHSIQEENLLEYQMTLTQDDKCIGILHTIQVENFLEY